MQKKSVKKGTWLGIVGFVLSIVMFSIVFLFTDSGCARFDPLGEVKLISFSIGSIIILVVCILALIKFKGSNNVIKTLIVVGIIISGYSLMYAVTGFFLHGDPCGDFSGVMCVEAKLNITDINIEQNTVTVERIRGGDGEDVTGVKFTVNGVAAAANNVNGVDCTDCDLSLKVLDTNTFTLGADIQPGDEITVAAQVGDSMTVCNIADEKIA